MLYVNCGCGNKYVTDKEWCNIDFSSTSRDVKKCNLIKGLPFEDNSVDAIFSSHMLEHFTREQAKDHIKECYRCLRDGGVCRIVVPDLENICSEYLHILNELRNGKEVEKKYEYVVIELLDQMVRTTSGGDMAKYWESDMLDDEYVRERTGYPKEHDRDKKLRDLGLSQIIKIGLKKIGRKCFGKLNAYKKLELASFELSGELHRWMYDEYSMSNLMRNAGFFQVQRKSAEQSDIVDWNKFGLEFSEGIEYKPNSLYMEAVK